MENPFAGLLSGLSGVAGKVGSVIDPMDGQFSLSALFDPARRKNFTDIRALQGKMGEAGGMDKDSLEEMLKLIQAQPKPFAGSPFAGFK